MFHRPNPSLYILGRKHDTTIHLAQTGKVALYNLNQSKASIYLFLNNKLCSCHRGGKDMEYFAICGITVNNYREDHINYASSLHDTVSFHYLNELKLIFKFTSSIGF